MIRRLDDLPILTAARTRAAEQAVFDTGIPPFDLMVRAGEAAAEIVWRTCHARDTLVLCGPGNNGGDGFVLARALRDRGVPVRVAALGDSRTGDARRARAAWNGPVGDVATAEPASVVVDALFGIGLDRGLDDALAARLSALVSTAQHAIALDLPSGVDTDNGALLCAVPRFSLCIALGTLKPAHVLLPAADRSAALVCAPIGLTESATWRTLAAPLLAAPATNSHKYVRGLVAVVAGRMGGAAALAATAAARGGAGYVRVVGAQAILDLPHAVVRVSGRDDAALVDDRIAALLIGPGLGRGAEAATLLGHALGTGHPAVVDADGLGALAEVGLDHLPDRAILTPHAGEFAALFGTPEGSRVDTALAAARRSRAVVVMKGSDTVIAAPDGRVRVATGAPAWLSTAGTGDVLAGLCAARLAVGGDPFAAAAEAVWLHNAAGHRAGGAFIADDLPGHIAALVAARSA